MALAILLIIVGVLGTLIIFVPFFRSMFKGLLRFSFLIVTIFLAMAGVAILMNNETIFDHPSAQQRLVRFVARNSAATSENGWGDAPCSFDKPAKEEETRAKAKKQPEDAAAQTAQGGAQVTAQPTATPTPSPEDIQANLYDELMTRNYICEGDTPIAIGRAKLIGIRAADHRGTQRLENDQHRSAHRDYLNCVHTSRILGLEDDVRILVTPKSDVEICSQSKAGEPQSGSLLGFFPGDFGANMGHIKQFYAAMKDKADAYCKALEEKQKPKGPNR